MIPGMVLEELVVLDFSRDIAGPLVGQMLGDLGAKVIKIERPGYGDESREWGPPLAGDDHYSAYFVAFNRNKHSLSLDLRHPMGREVALDLLRRADLLVENFRGDTAKRLRLSPDDTAELNPRLVHLSVSGFGRDGTDRGTLPGYDLVLQGMSGLMSVTGEPEGPPTRFGLPIVDILTGLYGTIAVLAALRARETTGEGQWIDLALHDVGLAALSNIGTAFLNTGAEPRRWGNVNPMLVPLQSFETANGDIIVAVANDEQWQRFCAAAELSELAEDRRFATNTGRVEHRDDLVPRIAEVISQRDTQDWLARLRKHGVPAGPVRTVSEALADPLVEERKLIWKGEGEDKQELLMLANPLAHLSRTPARLYDSPPAPGENTAQVLGDFLGYSERKVEKLRETGAV